MSLIISISGIRGTVGGKQGDNLTPSEIIKFTAAYAQWIRQNSNKEKPKIIVGRDARLSGQMIDRLVQGVLLAMNCSIIDIGMATTPTTEIAVTEEQADGGIIITASHNPIEWNALKLLDSKGEFIDHKAIAEIINLYENFSDIEFFDALNMGVLLENIDYTRRHIDLITALETVDTMAISEKNFTVAVDCINSVGAIAIPLLLKKLGVKNIIELNCVPDGRFSHTPEPLEKNLGDLMQLVREKKADVGFAVDPDVDRLAIICEDGTYFGEEYTLVAVADYILQTTPGNTVSNLSSSRALRDITQKYGGNYYASAVGELNVVQKMKEVGAVIGGEGNGGVIYPALHYGRDALVGIALFLSYMARSGMTPSQIRKLYKDYYMSKKKAPLKGLKFNEIAEKIISFYKDKADISTIDGVKLDFPDSWAHIRKSNTEPIVRIYTEAESQEQADKLADEIIKRFFAE